MQTTSKITQKGLHCRKILNKKLCEPSNDGWDLNRQQQPSKISYRTWKCQAAYFRLVSTGDDIVPLMRVYWIVATFTPHLCLYFNFSSTAARSSARYNQHTSSHNHPNKPPEGIHVPCIAYDYNIRFNAQWKLSHLTCAGERDLFKHARMTTIQSRRSNNSHKILFHYTPVLLPNNRTILKSFPKHFPLKWKWVV